MNIIVAAGRLGNQGVAEQLRKTDLFLLCQRMILRENSAERIVMQRIET